MIEEKRGERLVIGKLTKENSIGRSGSLLVAGLCLTASAFSQTGKMTSAQMEVVQAERAFARYCIEHGIAESWMEFFADDGIIFRPGPVNAKEFYRKQVPTPRPLRATLNWEPRYGDVSQAGDLGYSMGPWNYVTNVLPKEPDAHGYFFSIWKRQTDGKWRVAMDFGTGEIPAATEDHMLGKPFEPARQYKLRAPHVSNPAVELQALTEMDQRLASSPQSGGVLDTYLALVSDDAKTFKPGARPADKQALRTFIPAGKEFSLVLAPIGGDVAKSNDLAYTYGSYNLQEGGRTKEKGYYVHMWKRNESGKWKIVVTNFSGKAN